eukprot:COSAG05_NODE_767_length_7468_cov_379.770118_5_plen_94_part_00
MVSHRRKRKLLRLKISIDTCMRPPLKCPETITSIKSCCHVTRYTLHVIHTYKINTYKNHLQMFVSLAAILRIQVLKIVWKRFWGASFTQWRPP